jgi:hypothetical protein
MTDSGEHVRFAFNGSGVLPIFAGSACKFRAMARRESSNVSRAL